MNDKEWIEHYCKVGKSHIEIGDYSGALSDFNSILEHVKNL